MWCTKNKLIDNDVRHFIPIPKSICVCTSKMPKCILFIYDMLPICMWFEIVGGNWSTQRFLYIYDKPTFEMTDCWGDQFASTFCKYWHRLLNYRYNNVSKRHRDKKAVLIRALTARMNEDATRRGINEICKYSPVITFLIILN